MTEVNNLGVCMAINAIMHDVSVIAKNSKAPQYMFRGIDSVMNEMQKHFARHGLFLTRRILDKRHELLTNPKGNTFTMSFATVEVTYNALDGSTVTDQVEVQAMDFSDKASNKLMSVAIRESILKVFCIPTEDQNDGDAEEPKAPAPIKYDGNGTPNTQTYTKVSKDKQKELYGALVNEKMDKETKQAEWQRIKELSATELDSELRTFSNPK